MPRSSGFVFSRRRSRVEQTLRPRQSTEPAAIDREEARCVEDGFEARVHASVPLHAVWPHRRLSELNRRRPAANDAGAAVAWCEDLDRLAGVYACEGEDGLCLEVLRQLVQRRGRPADCWRLAGQPESGGSIAGALAVQQRLLVSPPADRPEQARAAAEIAPLQPLLRTRDDLAADLLRLAGAHADRSALDRRRSADDAIRVAESASLTIFSGRPQAIALFWLDPVGLYRWEWRGAPPLVDGLHSIPLRVDTPGSLTVIAVASPAALTMSEFPPIERADVDKRDTGAIGRYEAFLAAFDEWILRPEAAVAVIRIDVE